MSGNMSKQQCFIHLKHENVFIQYCRNCYFWNYVCQSLLYRRLCCDLNVDLTSNSSCVTDSFDYFLTLFKNVRCGSALLNH